MTENMQAECASSRRRDLISVSLTFFLIHGLFWLCWYCIVFGAYCYYFIGYTIWWGISTIIDNKKIPNNAEPSDTMYENLENDIQYTDDDISNLNITSEDTDNMNNI